MAKVKPMNGYADTMSMYHQDKIKSKTVGGYYFISASEALLETKKATAMIRWNS